MSLHAHTGNTCLWQALCMKNIIAASKCPLTLRLGGQSMDILTIFISNKLEFSTYHGNQMHHVFACVYFDTF